jgi:leucyl-tRNA synthetase
LRYPFTEYNNIPFGGEFSGPKSQFKPVIDKIAKEESIARMKKWGPVTSYIGGKEHTVLHLLYARFITMVFYDLGYIDFEEPFSRFVGHGLITKDGAKMSKSKGNVVNPDEYIAKFGADAIRLYLRFIGPFVASGDWRDNGLQGMSRFVNKMWNLYQDYSKVQDAVISNPLDIDMGPMHRTIKEVGEDLESLKFNTAVAKIMEYINWFVANRQSMDKVTQKECLTTLALIIAPLAPHIAEEFWAILGNGPSIHDQLWPKFDVNKLETATIMLPIQVNGKVRASIEIKRGTDQAIVEGLAKKNINIAKYLADQTIKKTIFVKDKIINFII